VIDSSQSHPQTPDGRTDRRTLIWRTASEDTGLINRVIKFHLAQRMWSGFTNVTDRRTSYDGNTAPAV